MSIFRKSLKHTKSWSRDRRTDTGLANRGQANAKTTKRDDEPCSLQRHSPGVDRSQNCVPTRLPLSFACEGIAGFAGFGSTAATTGNICERLLLSPTPLWRWHNPTNAYGVLAAKIAKEQGSGCCERSTAQAIWLESPYALGMRDEASDRTRITIATISWRANEE